jgi:hypothetical protein
VDKAAVYRQHAQIGIHLGSDRDRHADDIHENLKQKSAINARAEFEDLDEHQSLPQ